MINRFAGLGVGVPNTPIASGVSITPGASDQAITEGNYDGTLGSGKVVGDADLIAGNIKTGKTIFGVAGSIVTDIINPSTSLVLAGSTTEKVTLSETFVKQYNTYTLKAGGTYRIYTSLKISSAVGFYAYLELRVNGVAVASHSRNQATYLDYYDDIEIVSGDVVTLYLRTDSSSYYAQCNRFQIYYSTSDLVTTSA